jgi:hypothetical protein
VAAQFDIQPRGLRASPMFVGSLVAAVASTVVLTVLAILQAQQPPPRANPQNPPPPPPPPHLMAGLIIVAAIFVVAWVAVLLAVARDTIMRRIDAHESRFEAVLAEKINEYGELRETDGYVYGVHQTNRAEQAGTAQAGTAQAEAAPPEAGKADAEQAGRATRSDYDASNGVERVRTLYPVPPVD